MKPAAAAAVLTASTAFAQAPAAYNPSEVLELFSRDEFSDSQARSFQPRTPVELPNNVDINLIRRGLESAVTDAHNLHHSLDAQSRSIPAVRQYLGSVLQLEARAQMLARQITNRTELERALPELRALDTDWKDVSYRLAGVRGLDRASLDLIRRLDATSDQVSKSLQLGQTVDYVALVQKTNALRTSIERLIQDLDFEVGRTPEGSQLIVDGQRVQQKAAHLADTSFQQDGVEHLIEDFKLVQQAWTPFLAKLRGLNSRYIDRDVQQVAQVEREVSALLRIEQTLDRQQLVYLADNLTRNVDDFFDNAQLKLLIRLPESDQALSTADAFYGVFENFVDCVNRGENQADLQDAFSYIEGEWRNFSRVYRPLNSTEGQQVLNAIEKDVVTLRQALLIQEGFDRFQAGELASVIDNLSLHLERDTRSWLGKARPPYAAEAQREIANFRQNAQELHEALVANANIREVRQMCDGLFDSWRRVYNHIIQCRTSERSSLASASSQMTPALVELRTLLSR
ncbi:MAG: hypothetical protein WBC44_11905 [Planctomycetaceae bacterium]